MFTFDAFTHLVTGYADVHRRRRTERLIESLPFDTRKDIGWRNGSRQISPATDPWR